MDVIIFIMFGSVIIFSGAVGYMLFKDSKKGTKKKKTKEAKNNGNSPKAKDEENININASQDILDFEEIQICNEDVALVKYKENIYLGYIEVQGINFNLLSIDERIMLEESFGELMNGLDFPAQIYIQSRRTDLDQYVSTYEKSIESMRQKIDKMKHKNISNEYIKNFENQLHYGEQLLDYFVQRTVHANLLERKYFFIVKYVHNPSSYEHDLDDYEILSAAFNDIGSKASLIMDSLARSNMKAKLASTFDLGELLYGCYNRSDATNLKFTNAVKSEYNHLFTTAKPVEIKRIEEEIRKSEENEKKLMNELKEIVKSGEGVKNESI